MSKSSEAADAEGASTSSKNEIVKGLNEDLSREYKAIIQYSGAHAFILNNKTSPVRNNLNSKNS
jgi:hypothetical protein